jgi:uncharacterized membrane protein
MRLLRLLRHLMMPRWRARLAFPRPALARIERAIAASEQRHRGQIRFAVEHALDAGAILRNRSARDRGLEVFSLLGVWDTEDNCGVLVYLMLADRDVEIIADRAIHAIAGRDSWVSICREMEAAFRMGRYEAGVLAGVERISALLEAHFPRRAGGHNELPDKPVVL